MTIQRFSRRILIVDDEIPICETMALIFRMQHYEVRMANSAERAIETLSVWQPDLAVLDVMLPEMNGIDLAIAIKANYSSCQVILFSGHANTAMLVEEAGRKGHHFEVLSKPVHPSVMLEKASAMLSTSDDSYLD